MIRYLSQEWDVDTETQNISSYFTLEEIYSLKDTGLAHIGNNMAAMAFGFKTSKEFIN